MEAVTAAKRRRNDTSTQDRVRTLSTGVRIRLRPVALGLWQEALKELRKKEPKAPMVPNPDKGGKLQENPADPDYLAALAVHQDEMNRVSQDVLMMWGMELVEGVPEDDWLKRLQFLAKRGTISLEGADLDDPLDREYLYKKHVAVGPQDAALLSGGWGASEEEVAEAGDFFPGDETRGSDTGLPPPG